MTQVWETVQVCCEGYEESSSSTCTPVCQEDCIHGFCARPNQCDCNEGYVFADNNATTCIPCREYCEDNNCVECSCPPQQEMTFSSNCSLSCQDICLNTCTDTHTCPTQTEVPSSWPPSSVHCVVNCSPAGGKQMNEDFPSENRWILVGVGLAAVVLLFVLVIAITLFVKKKKEKLSFEASQDDVELMDKSQNMSEENILYGASDMSLVTSQKLTKENILCKEVQSPPVATNIISDQYDFYEQVKTAPVSTDDISEGYDFYEQVKTVPVGTQDIPEEYDFYDQIKVTPGETHDVSDEYSFYEKVQEVPVETKNVSEENILYGKIEERPLDGQTVSEENILYGKIEAPPVDEPITEENGMDNEVELPPNSTRQKDMSRDSTDSVLYDQIQVSNTQDVVQGNSKTGEDRMPKMGS